MCLRKKAKNNEGNIMIEQNKLHQLPNGWVWTRLGDIRLHESQSVVPSRTPEGMFELYSVPRFNSGMPEIILGRDIGSSKQIVREDTVLLCKINPRINRVWVVSRFSPYVRIASTEWIPFSKIEGLDPQYLRYFMCNSDVRNFLAKNASGVGGSLMRVKPGTLARYPFPLPPLPEQERIVAKIEELFTRLEAGVEALKKVKAQIKRYRQAVLKYAFLGKLTQGWRKAHKETLVGLEDLRFEIGKLEDWEIVRIGDLFDIKTGSTPRTDISNYWDGGIIKWITPKDLGQLQSVYILDTNRKITQQGLKSCSTSIMPPDSIIISTRAPIGYIAILNDYMAFNQGCKGLVKRSSDVFVTFVYYVLLTKVDEMNFLGSGSTFKEISKSQISNLQIPLPPLPEQHQIVSEIERRFSIADEVEQVVDQSLKQASRLRQSILKKAYEGRLVPQDLSDEPAEKLLERIKQECILSPQRHKGHKDIKKQFRKK